MTTPQQPELPALPEPASDILTMRVKGSDDLAFVRGVALFTEAQMRAHEQTAIAHFLDTTGQYVTNDATRQAAINAAVLADRESRKPWFFKQMAPSNTIVAVEPDGTEHVVKGGHGAAFDALFNRMVEALSAPSKLEGKTS